MIKHYLERHSLYPSLIEEALRINTTMIVVIPSCNEEYILNAIESLFHCEQPEGRVEVLVIFNASEDASKEVKRLNDHGFEALRNLNHDHVPSWITVYPIIFNQLPKKHAGVGLARKIGMDEAVRRLEHTDGKGIIICYDADSQCLPNFFVEIEKAFRQASVHTVSIHFDHPKFGNEYDAAVYQAIEQYEKHLRYFIDIQKYIGLPYAYQTVGSSMATTVEAYVAVGGMNKRKAGEDFYFMHKLIKYGGCYELNSTTVIPSPRISDRVPFGTGRAVSELVEKGEVTYYTYHPKSFWYIHEMVEALDSIYAKGIFPETLPLPLLHYMQEIKGSNKLLEIKKHTASYKAFVKRFFHWFDAFQLMKYLHFTRDHYIENIPVDEAVAIFEKERKAKA